MKNYACSAMNEISQFPNIELRGILREFVDYTIFRNNRSIIKWTLLIRNWDLGKLFWNN